MSNAIEKQHPTVGCCGIDCGLCPRYHVAGNSKCPGCAGPGFRDLHPSCSVVTCCVKKNGLETCAECPRYPCERIAGQDETDSFVTHKNCFKTLDFIKTRGTAPYIQQQARRMEILEYLLEEYNEGRSKSFFCLATTLLKLPSLERALAIVATASKSGAGKKQRVKDMREALTAMASQEGIELKLRPSS